MTRPYDPAFVYKMRDQNGNVIYAGQSLRVPRLREHENEKEWFPEVHTIEVVHTTVAEVDELELRTIKESRPKYNVIYNSDAQSSLARDWQRHPPRRRDEVRTWLLLYLMNHGGRVRVTDIQSDASAAGYTLKTLRNAKEGSGVYSVKDGHVWYWQTQMPSR